MDCQTPPPPYPGLEQPVPSRAIINDCDHSVYHPPLSPPKYTAHIDPGYTPPHHIVHSSTETRRYPYLPAYEHPPHPQEYSPESIHEGQPWYAPAPPPGFLPQGQGYVQQPTDWNPDAMNQPYDTAALIPIHVSDYMGLSIFSCLCCWCLGLLAIKKSVESRRQRNDGNYREAAASAIAARNLSIASILGGIIVITIIIVNTVY